MLLPKILFRVAPEKETEVELLEMRVTKEQTAFGVVLMADSVVHNVSDRPIRSVKAYVKRHSKEDRDYHYFGMVYYVFDSPLQPGHKEIREFPIFDDREQRKWIPPEYYQPGEKLFLEIADVEYAE